MPESTGVWTNWRNWWARPWRLKAKIWPNWKRPTFWSWRFAIYTNWGNAKLSAWARLRRLPDRPTATTTAKTNSALDSRTAPPKCLATWPPPPAWTWRLASDFSLIWDAAFTNWKLFRLPVLLSRRPATLHPALPPSSSSLNFIAFIALPSCLRCPSVRLFPTSWIPPAAAPPWPDLATTPNTRSVPICILRLPWWPTCPRKSGGLGRKRRRKRIYYYPQNVSIICSSPPTPRLLW